MEEKRTTEAFAASGRNLADAFFLERDRQLIARKAELLKMAETKEALAAVSGIKEPEVLDLLVDLNVRPETLAALTAIPLVEVVWADGKVDEKERKVVLDFARAQGIAEGSVERDLLERWLDHRPESGLLAAWQHYIQALCARLSVHQREHLQEELLRHVRAAAEASGGFLGMGKISAEERAVLEKLESSFRVG
jgi:tellurite resistance protein